MASNAVRVGIIDDARVCGGHARAESALPGLARARGARIRQMRLVQVLASTTCWGLTVLSGPAFGEARTAFGPWTEAGFEDAEQRMLGVSEIYPRGRPKLPLRLNATVLFDRATPWTQARAIGQIRRTAAIFAPCGIALDRVRLVRLRLPPGLRRVGVAADDSDSGVPRNVVELAASLPPETDYPAAFLVGRVVAGESLAVSFQAPQSGVDSAPYFDTAWIAYQAHWLPRADDRYSPLAHEFAHLLCRCGHLPGTERHLLHEARNFLSANVLPEHCERFQESSLVVASD